jgi:gluconate 2-dehydrogenase gamma chain
VSPVYRPQFFSPAQYQTVELLVDLILPAIQNAAQKLQPGAKEAGVAEFIDFMVFSDQTMQAPFRHGLQWLDHAGTASFTSLAAEEQTAILERLAYKAKQRESEKSGQQFFHLLRKYTVMGFYTSRVGLESLDYPGLTFYATSPGCTHQDNPEHVGL